MASLFRISSIIYRIGLLVILVLYISDLAVEDDELIVSNSSFEGLTFLSFVCLPLITLTVYQNIEVRLGKLKNIFRIASIFLGLTSLFFILKLLFDSLISLNKLVIGDIGAYTVISLFGLINVLVLYGLFKKKI